MLVLFGLLFSLAQAGTPQDLTHPQSLPQATDIPLEKLVWITKPAPDVLKRAISAKGINENVRTARVNLICRVVNEQGRVNCTANFESPTGHSVAEECVKAYNRSGVVDMQRSSAVVGSSLIQVLRFEIN